MNTINDSIIKAITDKNTSSGGHCGMLLTDIMSVTGLGFREVKSAIENLLSEGVIVSRPCQHGELYFLKGHEKRKYVHPKSVRRTR